MPVHPLTNPLAFTHPDAELKSTVGGRSYSPTISFELQPPRNPDRAPQFWATAKRLVTYRPDFISVTYGAGGHDHNTTQDVVVELLNGTAVEPMAHLTCIRASREDITGLVNSMLGAGTRAFLALRGDPPNGERKWQTMPNGINSAIDLIKIVRKIEQERAATDASFALRASLHPLVIAVAAFPGGNKSSGTTQEQEIQRLLEKQEAGANFAITQLLFDAQLYFDFVAAAREAGVTMPIIAGIVPVTGLGQLDKISSITKISPPPELVAALIGESDNFAEFVDYAPLGGGTLFGANMHGAETGPEEYDAVRQYQVGIEYTTKLASELLAGGAPGLHLFTFNQAAPSLDVLRRLEIRPRITNLAQAL